MFVDTIDVERRALKALFSLWVIRRRLHIDKIHKK